MDLILLDTSASTLGSNALSHALGIVKGVSRYAYLKRHHIGIITFGNNRVATVLTPRRAPQDINPVLTKITAGGGTPLRKGLLWLQHFLQKLEKSNRFSSRTVYLFTDGRSRDDIADITLSSQTIVIDTEQKIITLGKATAIAQQLGATYIHMNEIA